MGTTTSTWSTSAKSGWCPNSSNDCNRVGSVWHHPPKQPHVRSTSYFLLLALSPSEIPQSVSLCWSIRGTSIQHSAGPSGPTATSPYTLYLARSLEVSEIATRFHVTETSPALCPPLLSPAFCLPSQVLSGPVKALWIVSNLIVLILLPVHGRRKSARRVGFPFVTARSSLPGNTLHSNHNLIVNAGIVGEPVMPIALLAFSVTREYHISLDLDNEQRPFSDLADIFVLTHPPSLTKDLLCLSVPQTWFKVGYIWTNYCRLTVDGPHVSAVFYATRPSYHSLPR